MAPPVGQALREARKERGIKLSEVERVTKIRVKFLRAMEEDRWDDLPAPAYARGFLSTYARFLDLDDQALVDQYKRTAEPTAKAEPIPYQVVQRGGGARRRPIRPAAMVVAGLLAATVLGLVIVGLLGDADGTDDGRDLAEQRERTAGDSATDEESTTDETTTEESTALASEVSVELRSTATVWVCLVDDGGGTFVNGETLTANEVRGPFEGSAFEVTFGNGSVEMTVDGEPAEVPPVAEPLGYRITPSGVRELEPSSAPTCL
jgi:cytoskeletal protein RodZ